MKTRLSLWIACWPVAAGLFFAAGCKRGEAAKSAAGAPPVPVQVATATREDVPVQIEAVGVVQALRTVSVKSQVDGIVAHIHFQEGTEVAAGTPLVTLDRRPFENALRQAQAALATARAQAAQAAADAERYAHLDQQAAISKEAYAQYLTKADTARADVQAREAALATAELQLSYTEIRAPISGRTGQRLLHEGALVKANDNNFTLVTINQLAPVAVAFGVPEGALEAVRKAQATGAVEVSVADRAGRAALATGRLEFVDNTVDPATGMIMLKAVFSNENQALWPGRFVSTVTQVGVDRAAVVVPTTAVQNSQRGTTVYVLKADQSVELRPVTVARVLGERTLLKTGVQAGETVVTDGQIRLLPGMKAAPRQLESTASAAPASKS